MKKRQQESEEDVHGIVEHEAHGEKVGMAGSVDAFVEVDLHGG